MRDCGTCMFRDEIILTGIVVHVHECMLRLCILLNSLLYICKSELRKSQSGIKGFFFATGGSRPARPAEARIAGLRACF